MWWFRWSFLKEMVWGSGSRGVLGAISYRLRFLPQIGHSNVVGGMLWVFMWTRRWVLKKHKRVSFREETMKNKQETYWCTNFLLQMVHSGNGARTLSTLCIVKNSGPFLTSFSGFSATICPTFFKPLLFSTFFGVGSFFTLTSSHLTLARCRVRCSFLENALLHFRQTCGLIPVCLSVCRSKWDLSENFSKHSTHS